MVMESLELSVFWFFGFQTTYMLTDGISNLPHFTSEGSILLVVGQVFCCQPHLGPSWVVSDLLFFTSNKYFFHVSGKSKN